MNRKGAIGWGGAIVIVLLLAIAGALFLRGGDMSLSVPDKDDGEVVACGADISPDRNIKAYDAENVGTVLTESTNIYRKVGTTSWSTFTQGTEITDLEPGATYEVVMGISASDMTDNAYGPHFITDPIECKPDEEIEFGLFQDEVETSLSATFYNADGDAGAEAFTTGQTQTVSVKFAAGTDEVFGNPFIEDSDARNPAGQDPKYPNVFCMDLNSTAWDQPVKVSFDGVEMDNIPTPQRHSAVTGKTTYCYEAPVIDESTMENVRYNLRLNADDSNAPAVDDTGYIYAAGFYVNSDSGEIEWGVEDNDGTAVGTDASDSVTLDFTA